MMQFEVFLARLKKDYPKLKFRVGTKFMFRPPRTIIYVEPGIDTFLAGYFLQFLHEIGHALLGHRDFRTDSERVKMECEAWQKARELCDIYDIAYDEEFAEAELDTYRDWLHQKSLCKDCGLTRYQTVDGAYHCPFCETYRVTGV